MLFPWVSREKLRAARKATKLYLKMAADARAEERIATEKLEAAIARAETAVSASAELRASLERSERERTDLQVKLLRVGFGINPFHELVAAEADTRNAVETSAPAEPQAFEIRPGMSDQEVQAAFVAEAQTMYGQNLRAIRAHVEKRQREYYSTHQRQTPIVSAADMAQARQIAAQLQADIEEGRANAAAKG